MHIGMLNWQQIDRDQRGGIAFVRDRWIAYADGDMFVDTWPRTPAGSPRYHVATDAERAEIVATPGYAEWRQKADERMARDARRAALRARAEAEGQSLYLRSGMPPASGRSYNHRDNRAEAGVSVYRAWYLVSTRELVVDVADMDMVSSMFILFDGDRPLYEVAGTELAGTRGSDGEPLLAEVTSARPLRKRWKTMELVP